MIVTSNLTTHASRTDLNGVGYALNNKTFIKNTAERKHRIKQREIARQYTLRQITHIYDIGNPVTHSNRLYDYLAPLRVPWISSSSPTIVTTDMNFTDILRSNRLDENYSHLEQTIDHLHRLMKQYQKSDPVLSYRYELALDCCVPYLLLKKCQQQYTESIPFTLPPGFSTVSMQESLPDFHLALFESILSDTVLLDTPWHHVFSKLFPRAGVSRLLASILGRYMFLPHPNQTVFLNQINEILLCGILGNYTHVPNITSPLPAWASTLPPSSSSPPPSSSSSSLKHTVQHVYRSDLLLRMIGYAIYRHGQVPNFPCAHATPNKNTNDTKYTTDVPVSYQIYGLYYHEWASVRTKLYQMLLEPPMSRYPMLVLREYSIHVIESNPILKHHLSKTMDYEYFKQTTLQGMNAVRHYLSTHLLTPKGKITLDEIDLAYVPGPDIVTDEDAIATGKLRPWQVELSSIVLEAYDRIKDESSYRKPVTDTLTNLAKIRGRVPPSILWIHNPVLPKGTIVYLKDPPKSGEKCSVTRREKRLGKHDHQTPGTTTKTTIQPEFQQRKRARIDSQPSIHHKEQKKETKSMEQQRDRLQQDFEDEAMYQLEQGRETSSSSFVGNVQVVSTESGMSIATARELTRERIFIEHHQYLKYHIETTVHQQAITDERAFWIICDLALDCGASPDGLAVAKRKLVSHTQGSSTRNTWEQTLKTELRSIYPYTYNLLLAAASIWYHHISIKTYDLPLEIRINQIRAIARRYQIHFPATTPHGTELPVCLPELIGSFYWCSVCNRIYTIGYETRRSSKRCATQGIQACRYDIINNTMYCGDPITSGSQSCNDQPLRSVDMIGKIVHFRGKQYTICTRPNCGFLFHMDPFTTINGPYGPQCLPCSIEERSSRHILPNYILRLTHFMIRPSGQLTGEIQTYETQPRIWHKCFLCGDPIRLNQRVYIFGFDTFVCGKRRHFAIRTKDGSYKDMIGEIVSELKKKGHPITIDESLPTGSPNSYDDAIVRPILVQYHQQKKTIEQEHRKQYYKKRSAQHKQQVQQRKIHNTR